MAEYLWPADNLRAMKIVVSLLEEAVGDFRKLEVWQKAQWPAASIYRLTGGFPTVERYGLTSQMRRAAVSVSANLAEGCGRMGDTELRRQD